MKRRTTIEIDEDLLERARRVLGGTTMRATVEEALRRVTEIAEDELSVRTAGQRAYLERLASHVDIAVLASDEMWR